jgi:hypothetical protein
MQERTTSLRERKPPTVRASWAGTGFRDRHLKGLVVVVVAALFLAATGAFDTDGAPAALRYPYWLVIMLAGGVIGSVITETFGRRGWLEERPWLQGGAVTLAISVPQTLAVWVLSAAIFRHALDPKALLVLFPAVVLISGAITALNHLVARRPLETHAAPAGGEPPRFLERLPFKLRGADLYAVEAEDHYLRVHTDRGSDLILMRLSDAVAELEGLEGAQTHRSWWVAKDAVTDARRSDGRAVLTLKNGSEAPVSRTYARALREAGWF